MIRKPSSAVSRSRSGFVAGSGPPTKATPAATKASGATKGPFALPPLPYAEDALAPHISARTMSFHYGKHHRGYVEKLNAAVKGKKLADMELEEVIVATAKDPSMSDVFNNAAQAWNHAFYWKSMDPKGGGKPSGKLAQRIKEDFGGLEGFKKAFAEAANGQFGSGWAWLVLEDGSLRVTKTSNAHTPIARGGKPLLVIDVWEHAYYLDYQSERAGYVEAFLDHLFNWEFASSNFG